MSQMSLFSADTQDPAVDDLAGLLAGPGQSVHLSMGARVSVVVSDLWRAEAICADIRATGFETEIVPGDDGRPLARTEVNPRLTALHRRWSAGAVKAVPEGWMPSPRALRLWAIAAGRPDGRIERDGMVSPAHYVLGLDPHAPETHAPLSTALMRVGIAPTLVGPHGPRPALRITGKKRLTRLLETIGERPLGVPGEAWPHP